MTAAAPPHASAATARAAAPVRTSTLPAEDSLTGVYWDSDHRPLYLFHSKSKLVGCFSLTNGKDDSICEGDFESFEGTPHEGETFRYVPWNQGDDDEVPLNGTAFSDSKWEGDYLLDVQDGNCGMTLQGWHGLKRAPGKPLVCHVTRSTKLEVADRALEDKEVVQLTPGQRLQAFTCDPFFDNRLFVRLVGDVDKVGYVPRADLACDGKQL